MGELRDDNTGASSYALTAAPTGPSSDSPAQPSSVPSLGATVGTHALRQDVTPTEPTPLSPNELTAVAIPARVGDLVAARQASFTQAWYRAWMVRVTTAETVRCTQCSGRTDRPLPDVPLSRLRSLKPLDGPPDADTAAGLLPPTLTTGRPTTNEGLHAAVPEPERRSLPRIRRSLLPGLPSRRRAQSHGRSQRLRTPATGRRHVAPARSRTGTRRPGGTDQPGIAIRRKAPQHGSGPLGCPHGMARHVERRALGQGRSVEASTGGSEPTLQGNETPCTTDA